MFLKSRLRIQRPQPHWIFIHLIIIFSPIIFLLNDETIQITRMLADYLAVLLYDIGIRLSTMEAISFFHRMQNNCLTFVNISKSNYSTVLMRKRMNCVL